jgi:drug/metabolite transporter (DMT)-like permease
MSAIPIKPVHWAAFALCVTLWGSAYAMVHVALSHGAPPAVIVGARLWISALILLVWLRVRSERLPPKAGWKDGRWPLLMALGFLGATLPFTLLSWAQNSIDSGLAGILAAITPLIVAVAAPLVAPEDKLTIWRIAGFSLGFAGIVVLMGPSALAGLGGPMFLGQLAAAAAAVSYAANTLLARAGPAMPALSASAGWTLFGALWSTPFMVTDFIDGARPDSMAWTMILLLGIGPTAIASVAYFWLIRAAGPSFVTQTNFVIPLVAVTIGIIAFGEEPGINAFAALCLIGAGLWLAQRVSPPREQAEG